MTQADARGNSPGRIARVIGTIIAVQAGLLLASLVVLSLIADIFQAATALPVMLGLHEVDARVGSPSYPDAVYARAVYRDQRELRDSFIYMPFIEWRQRQMATATINIDANGLRMHPGGRPNDAGARTIGFFGGSAMWGYGVPDDATIPALFDGLTDDFLVTNYGELAYTSRQNLEMLVSLINQNAAPDIVVFYDGFNDVRVHCDRAATAGYNGHYEERLMRAVLEREQARSQLYKNLVAPVVDLLQRLYRRVASASKFDFACDTDAARAERVADTMIRNWQIAERLVSGYGGRFFAFLQPVAVAGDARVDHLLGNAELSVGVGDDLARQLKAVYAVVQRKLADGEALWATDLADSFEGDAYIYVDAVHVSGQGNAIVTDRILNRIRTAESAAAGTRP